MSEARGRYDKGMGVRNDMAGSGMGMLAGGGGTLYAAQRMLKPGLDFDASMSKVQALTRLDKASPELKALREQARGLGESTSFTATQVAQGQGYLAMAGFKPEAIKASMPGVLNLAKAGGTELPEAADIGSNIMTGFKLPAEQMGRVSDVLVTTFTNSNTNLQMLGDTMKYAGPVAANLGVQKYHSPSAGKAAA